MFLVLYTLFDVFYNELTEAYVFQLWCLKMYKLSKAKVSAYHATSYHLDMTKCTWYFGSRLGLAILSTGEFLVDSVKNIRFTLEYKRISEMSFIKGHCTCYINHVKVRTYVVLQLDLRSRKRYMYIKYGSPLL